MDIWSDQKPILARYLIKLAKNSCVTRPADTDALSNNQNEHAYPQKTRLKRIPYTQYAIVSAKIPRDHRSLETFTPSTKIPTTLPVLHGINTGKQLSRVRARNKSITGSESKSENKPKTKSRTKSRPNAKSQSKSQSKNQSNNKSRIKL